MFCRNMTSRSLGKNWQSIMSLATLTCPAKSSTLAVSLSLDADLIHILGFLMFFLGLGSSFTKIRSEISFWLVVYQLL